MNNLFSIFQPAPPAEPIQDPDKVQNEYRYWRWRIFYSMFIGYALFYFTRKSFTFAMPAMIDNLGFDKSQLGFLATLLSLTYGLSKFVNGIFGDKSNARMVMSIGLILTGVFNILFGLSSSIWLFAIFWTLNGWFQGFGWPPCARLLTHWYSRSERGSWWSMWNISHNVGGAMIPIIAAFFAMHMGWRWAMYAPGIMTILAGFYLLNRLRDTPESLGLPEIEEYRNDPELNQQKKQSKKALSTKEILFTYILSNKWIWLLAFAYFFVYIVRTGFNDWTALFLVQNKSYSQMSANFCVSLFEIGGFVGSLAAGFASDHLFKARRAPVNILFAFGILASVLFFWQIPAGYPYLDGLAMFLIGFTIFGPQMLIGIAAAELSHKKAAATATGFVGWFAYAGAAAAGWPLGKVLDVSWEGFFVVMTACSLVSLFLLFPLMRAEPAPEILEDEPHAEPATSN